MIEMQELMAVDYGFTYGVAETTSVVSKDVFTRNGYKLVFERSYEDIMLGDRKLDIEAIKAEGFDPSEETACVFTKDIKSDIDKEVAK